MKICFATNNKNKVAEIQHALGDQFELVSLQEIGCHEELAETTGTIEGNSLQKAQYVWDHYQVSCFADDTGLEVEALGGEPGVDSAHYSGTRNADENMSLLLKNMQDKTDRQAQFRTVITLIENGEVKQFEGIAPGSMRTEQSGAEGFGYDPIFEPTGYDITFAEMDMTTKNEISHRGKAVQKLVDYLKK
ncbi:MAG: RdgB/HAM1 family non-canonical purine NTP pyrophosphatase [Cytophagales bacterium]|nr:RdgB/HAM1 family non-canonical purine NTP pyrophosphatase [Cytophagales bacterium]